jgi:hypothetical protein
MDLWRVSWEKFAQEVARCHADGMSQDEITDIFVGSKVTWSGTVRNNELGQDFSHGIALDMPEIKIRLLDGRLIVANYIFLSMDTSKLSYWQDFSPGQEVKFSAEIRKSQSAFPEVEVSICSSNPELLLMLGTENAQPVLYE